MSKFSKLLSVMLALVLTFGLISCGSNNGDNNTNPDQPTKLTVKFEKDSLTMNEWDTQKIGVAVSDGSGVEVKVDDPTVAYIRGSKINPLKAGETTLTATAKADPSVTAKMAIKVNAKPESRPVLGISGDEELAIGETAEYSAVLSNADANAYTVNWSVNDKSLATISKDGVLTAKASGEVKVTATAVYCTAEFKAEKTVVISQEINVVFAQGESVAKLAVSSIKEVSGEYTLEIAGKTYVADSDGNVTLNKADFDTTSTNVFEGKIIEGANVHEFKLIVYVLDKAKAYQDGKALIPDENGYVKVDTTKPADSSGLRWVTFDNAAAMNAIGYGQLEVTLKFDKFCELTAGMVHPNVGAYGYSFGYKFREKGDSEDTWVFWDNTYVSGGRAVGYCGAMKASAGAPYGYGYLKLYSEGELILDYYKAELPGEPGHGCWSSSVPGYIDKLETGKEYTLVLDTSKTGDIMLSGIDEATITKIEWTKKVETQISFENTEISVDEWVETALNATVNDGSQVTYSVSDPDVLYLNGNKIVGLNAGFAKVTATANGKTAELSVTVNAKEENRPALSIEVPAEIEIGSTATATASLKCGNTEIESEKYTVVFESSDAEKIIVTNATLTPIAAGSSTIKAKATYCGKEFTATADVLAKDPPAPVDPSVGKLYQGGEELTPSDDGSYVMDSTKESKTLTIDSWDAKKALGFKKVRLTVKFADFNENLCSTPYGTASFGYSYGSVTVGWWNDYVNSQDNKVYAWAAAFTTTANPDSSAYLKVYSTDGDMIFEHYSYTGWSSDDEHGGYGYIPALEANTEYIFEIDTEKTGDITLYGFDKATFTKIEWLDMKNTTVKFAQEEYTAEEWTAFNVKATTNDGSEVTYSVAENDEVLFVAGNKVIGVKAGESEVIATANGKTAKVKVVISENSENRPVLTVNENGSVKIKETLNVETALKIKETTVPEADYAVEVKSANENVSISGKVITGVTAGDSKITVTVTYCDVKFTAEFTVTVVDETIDPTIAKVYQTGKNVTAKQLTADSNGIYRIDTTTDEAGENNLYWFSFGDIPEIDGTQYKYLRFKVKFANFLCKQASEVESGMPNYHYSFGYKYNSVGTSHVSAGTLVHAFWDSKYSDTSGSWGGGMVGGGSAYGGTYINIYKAADNAKIANCIEHDYNWTNYFEALTENTDYIFEFDMSKMNNFRFSAFAGLEITDVKWADTLLG
ncbi:MAG: Ig-like domain-containing protein [Candidatus Borkfalkiaceae bacterium]|nr:Ig-like domain-containing protein [Christensenellaceae bacterium]